jgi:hypothetical protein
MELTPGGIKVFLFDRQPYVHLSDGGDLLMFPHGKDTFTARAVLGLAIEGRRDERDDHVRRSNLRRASRQSLVPATSATGTVHCNARFSGTSGLPATPASPA